MRDRLANIDPTSHGPFENRRAHRNRERDSFADTIQPQSALSARKSIIEEASFPDPAEWRQMHLHRQCLIY